MISTSNTPAPFDRDIDDLIYDIAEYQKDNDCMIFYRKILNTELFFSIITDVDKPSGTQITVEKNQITIPTVTAFDGLNMVLFHTSSQDSHLSQKYANIRGDKGLEMILQIPDADGLIIQNKEFYWVALLRKQIQPLLDNYL